MTATGSLSPRDAVELAHALAAEVAAREGIRALLVKGLVTSHHGLRPARVSADADVWVDPEAMDRYLDALERAGWRERETSRAFRDLVEHSTTLIHPGWPCDLDVHRTFPGFLSPPQEVFDALWARSETLEIAGRRVAIADKASSILITALHAMRSPHQTPRHGTELRGLASTVVPALAARERQDVLDLAIATGAVDTARPLLELLALELPAVTPAGASAELDAWRERTASGQGRTTQFLLHLRGVEWRARPRVLWRAIWPTEADFRIEHYTTPPGRWRGFTGRVARIGRGVRSLPGALRGRRLAHRGVTDDSLLAQQGEPS